MLLLVWLASASGLKPLEPQWRGTFASANPK